MSSPNQARRVTAQIFFQGADITGSMRPYFLSATYTDKEADGTDDLQLKLQDRDDIWLKKWLADAIDAAASAGSLSASSKAKTDGAAKSYKVTAKSGLNVRSGPSTSYGKYGALVCGAELQVEGIENGWAKVSYNGKTAYVSASYIKESGGGGGDASAAAPAPASGAGFKISAVFVRENWTGGGRDKVLDCGQFELDSVDASGPPNTITIKATALPYSVQIRQTEKSKAWEAYTLSGIANEMAAANGMACMFLTTKDPSYSRVEQCKQSDISFLSQLCHEAGISLKATNNLIVLFDQEDYEKKSPVLTIHQAQDERGNGRNAVRFLPRQLHGPRHRKVHRGHRQGRGLQRQGQEQPAAGDHREGGKRGRGQDQGRKISPAAQQVRKDRDLYAARQSGYRGRRHSQAHRLGCVGREIHCGAGCALGRLVRLYHAGQAAQDIGGILMGELQNILSRLVQTGTVTAVDSAKRRARVKFKDTGIISDWLYVLQHHGANFYIKPDAKHTHEITDTFTGGGTASEFPDHDHLPGSHLTYWMPKVNDRVLCLYLPVFNGDGFVLGGF